MRFWGWDFLEWASGPRFLVWYTRRPSGALLRLVQNLGLRFRVEGLPTAFPWGSGLAVKAENFATGLDLLVWGCVIPVEAQDLPYSILIQGQISLELIWTGKPDSVPY